MPTLSVVIPTHDDEVTTIERENFREIVIITPYDKLWRGDLVNYVKENYVREKVLRNVEIYARM